MMAVFQSSGKVPVVSNISTICVMVLSTAGSMSLFRFVELYLVCCFYFHAEYLLSISSLVSARRS